MQLLGIPQGQRETLLLGKNSDPLRGPPQISHLKASEYLSGGHTSPEVFGSYYRFSFVRNPWDRLVSFYKYRGHAYRCDFKTFLFRHMPKPGWTNDYCHVTPQYDFLYGDGRCLVDFVGRFENLQHDFDVVCHSLGIPAGPLPHVNRSLKRYTVLSVLRGEPRKMVRDLKRIARRGRVTRNTFTHYADYYDDESREFVAELYRKDIITFGYDFVDLPAQVG